MSTKINFYLKLRGEDENPPFPPRTLAEMRWFFIFQNISLLLTFFLPRVKKKKRIKTQKSIIAVEKMGVIEEGISMSY
jgi:hypothetical protein